MTREEERAIKDGIIAAYVAEHKRQPSSEAVWVRFWADERVIAHQATRTVEIMTAKAQWQAMMRAQEKT